MLRVGTVDQTLLQPAGDDTRIDWGHAYVAAPAAQAQAAIGASATLLDRFVNRGDLPEQDDAPLPRAADDQSPALAFVFSLGSVGAAPVSRHLMIAYDEIYAQKFLGPEAAAVLAARRRDRQRSARISRARLCKISHGDAKRLTPS